MKKSPIRDGGGGEIPKSVTPEQFQICGALRVTPGKTFQQLKVFLGDFKAEPKNKSNRNKERRTLILVLDM